MKGSSSTEHQDVIECVCGVNYNDGKAMVQCDHCLIWEHIHCSNHDESKKIFTCHKCKSKNVSKKQPSRSHTVDVQEIPDGDTSLFKEPMSALTQQLWKSTGYVYEKFNYKYKEFPEEKDETENELPAPLVYRTLRALMDEILRKENITYEEICDAVSKELPYLRKLNGEKYAYTSHIQAVRDGLRYRKEWAHLVGFGPKASQERKKQELDAAMEESNEGESSTSSSSSDEEESSSSSSEEY